jgi:hypothetical protein
MSNLVLSKGLAQIVVLDGVASYRVCSGAAYIKLSLPPQGSDSSKTPSERMFKKPAKLLSR